MQFPAYKDGQYLLPFPCYRILQAHPEIPYETMEMEFSDRYAVIVWICRNQLGRRNLTDEQKKLVPKEIADKIIADDVVVDILSLPDADKISKSDKAAIEAAIEAADEWDCGHSKDRDRTIRWALLRLPSAQPDRKTGRRKRSAWTESLLS